MVDVEIISMLMPAADMASKTLAATPGWVFIPAPTKETLATSVSTSTDWAPMSTAMCLEIRSASTTWIRGTVKLMSVDPSWDTF